MDDARDLLVRLRAAARKRRLGTHELANALGVPRATLRQWLGSTASRPRGAHAKRIRLFLGEDPVGRARADASGVPTRCRQSDGEAARHVARIRSLLVLLEEELGWFRDGAADKRAVYRRRLDAFESGYVSSLLTMLFDEEKFQRWKALTTHRFRRFRRTKR